MLSAIRAGSVSHAITGAGGLGPRLHRLRLRAGPPDEPGPPRPHGPAVRGARRASTPTASRCSRRRWPTDDAAGHRPRPPTTSPRCKAASADPDVGRRRHTGSAPRTTRPSRGMHEASARVVEGTRAGVRRRLGGAHRARGELLRRPAPRDARATPRGFCIYNDIAVGIQWLLDHGAERVAYVDVDVHHGDGVERIFWDDPRVLTISVHETGRALFPGTGLAGDIGGPTAQGEAVNVALPPGTGDAGLAARAARRGACRSCAPSSPTCSSPSTAATPTRRTRWPTSPCRVDAQRAAAERCTGCPTRCATAAGSRSAAAATRWSRSCRARGRT